MTKFVTRTCSEVRPDTEEQGQAEGKPLAAYRSAQAYVLLGDPGSGKTTAFRAESEALGDDSLFISARNFLIHESATAELRDKTLFIDGLDEVRVGDSDARKSFDQVRKLLLALGKPKFRISCREADWLGENDRSSLKYVSIDSNLISLRLNPLTPKDIEEILSGRLGVRDPERFVKQAGEAGVDGLLPNPQSLELLASAVSQGDGWPASRLKTFELACRQMARERNPEHRAGIGPPVGLDALIESAGRLCALQLISDLAGFSLDEASSCGNYPPLDECGRAKQQNLRATISSKLFSAATEGRIAPVHRQIAEFLGAKYLAGLIRTGLPAGRVIALMTGGDGIVVTPLRGLSAWLATHSGAVRKELIAKAPVGMGVYGDIHGFSPSEKEELLEELLRHPERLDGVMSSVKKFAPLVEIATKKRIRQMLSATDRSPAQEIRTKFILLAMKHGRERPRLARNVLQIVRDASWTPLVRQLALDALMRTRGEVLVPVEQLRELLTDLKADGISLSNRELCGTLLASLYPSAVRPEEVWDYLTELADTDLSGRYYQFWSTKLLAQSSDVDVPSLLDSLSSRVSRRKVAFRSRESSRLLIKLLERGLLVHRDGVDVQRVYAWLAIGIYPAKRLLSNPPEQLLRIRNWLEERPALQKQVILTGLLASRHNERVSFAAHKARERLLGAKLPKDFGLWCLEQAVTLAPTRPRVAEHLFSEAYQAHVNRLRGGMELSLKVLEDYASRDEHLKKVLDSLRSPPPPSSEEMKWRSDEAELTRTENEERRKWLAWIRSNETALLENRADPALLYQLAEMYFGAHLYNEGISTGEEALARVLRRAETVRAAMRGIFRAIDRVDLPTVKEIVGLARESKEHYLSLPLLASLQERESESPEFLSGMQASTVLPCLACYICWAPDFLGSGPDAPDWFQGLLRSRPRAVSKVAVQCAAAELGSGNPVNERCWDIAENLTDNDLARSVILDLLQFFPTRSNAMQLFTLDELIWRGVRYRAETDLLELARCKLSKARTDVGQRVRWLGLGLILSPDEYEAKIETIIQQKEKLIRHLARFYVFGADSLDSWLSSWEYRYADLDSSTLAIIVRKLARCFDPSRLKVRGVIEFSDEFRGSLFVRGLISILASKPDQGATTALESLLNDGAFSRWSKELDAALDAQRTIQRNAQYNHPTLEQVCETLSGRAPASAADLAALAVDLLQRIGERIRTSNDNKWRLFWNEGAYSTPTEPKLENSCRYALLNLLRPELPQSVTAQPEAQHANQARADIEVSSDGFHVPIEVKRNSDRRLWIAMREQLIAKYTLARETNGYGIYLVFWFGTDQQRRRSDGACPKSPEELTALLEEALGEGEARKVSVLVIDVCPPSTPRADSA